MSYNSDCFDVQLTLMNISSLKEEHVVSFLLKYRLLFHSALFIAATFSINHLRCSVNSFSTLQSIPRLAK